MIRAGARARARTHGHGGGERRDKVGEGHRHRETHKEERRKEVVEGKKWLWNTFFLNLKRESGKVVKAALFSTILTRFP